MHFAQSGLLHHDDVQRICSLFSQIHDGYQKVSLLSTFAFYLWREDQGRYFSKLVNEQIWPALNDLSDSDWQATYKAWREAYPVVWLNDRDRARDVVSKFPSQVRNECVSALVYALLNRQPVGEPFDRAGTSTISLDFSDMQHLLHLCEETDEDHLIFHIFERVADGLSTKRPRSRITREQKADITRRMLDISEKKLPVPTRIQHAGFQILCKAQALRIQEDGSLTWGPINS